MEKATKATLDESLTFVQLRMQVGTWTRDTLERTAAGLDGIVSIDLGRRHRILLQKGVLRAFSRAALDARLNALRALVDGRTHRLTIADASTFANVRLDGIVCGPCVTGGNGVRCEFEIKYTQSGE